MLMPKETSTNAVWMRDMSEDILERIAASLSPPSAFFLVSTSKKLFWSPSPKGPREHPLGVTIVQSALRRQLEVVLKAVTSRGDIRRPFTVHDLFPENLVPGNNEENPQVLLSGSLAVQSVLGLSGEDEKWKDADVDIFCTWKAAPFVRQRLMELCGLICSGVDNTYRQDSRDLNGEFEHSALSVIHHVESYNSRPTKGNTDEAAEYYSDLDLEYNSDEYYAQTIKWGAKVLISTGQRHMAGKPGGSAGGTFAYDWVLRRGSFVQLIVGFHDVIDARELLESFDLEICKSSFDGRVFRVPSPGNSFAGHTAVIPVRHNLIDDFMRNVTKFAPKVEYVDFYNEAMSKVLGNMNKSSWAGVGATPYKDTGKEADLMSFPIYDKYVDFQCRYIFITKLIKRMKKYAERGVKIDDPPHGALDWVVAEYDICC
ncbi:hypothetical protein CYMTET_11336 [Cymbomonas tetramitiformis]|uniref:Uncharacterized protein n=1 Tax=Cymbomonas tetramitiformis TaxID=36881 RepID=A0AAE0GMH6_9CHLO|nr:hypothetical protein CYMTET_11336 [Cymbomonas tetramitiformis]|eukprot:gene13283-15693_t